MKRDLDYVTKRFIRRCRTMMKNSAERSKEYLDEYRKGGNIEDYAYSRECRGYAMACKEMREWLIEDFKRKEECK